MADAYEISKLFFSKEIYDLGRAIEAVRPREDITLMAGIRGRGQVEGKTLFRLMVPKDIELTEAEKRMFEHFRMNFFPAKTLKQMSWPLERALMDDMVG